ncbi:MAG: GntR family transcriptional regulator [Pseudobutyrivibrio sp.]|uniref:GntR family transcriptional regulator n=1 Tax=Pseudobutyrivibrio sp. TaxID=2014367 RepID=UPI0025CCBD02|nr:GntR family transcriptional regulator [Pseudobutyrivibrio sp.]MBQ6461776.1 GntR family transcriptional regulator [Pseudobutyrivibrio sp.]MBQ8488751.1 GntR family transcriptional regulator [Pseudobutyrivibrio sp.]
MLENLGEDKSIYLQISEMIEDEILRDILREEEQVPSTTELSKFYKINPATAAKGINLLVDKDILYKKRGIGMFVQAGAKEKIMEARKKSFKETYLKKLITEAKLIGITKNDLKRLIDEITD